MDTKCSGLTEPRSFLLLTRTSRNVTELRRGLERLKAKGLPASLPADATLAQVIEAINRILEALK